MKVVRNQRGGTEPCRKRNDEARGYKVQRPVKPAAPSWTKLGRKKWVGSEKFVAQAVQNRSKESEAKHDAERELETRLEKLLRVPDQNEQRGSSQRIDQVRRPAKRPSGDDYGAHDRGAYGR